MMRMRRVICTLLLLLMPLQFSWAAVVPYCGHEAAPQSQHVGHHAHEHHADTPVLSSDTDAATESSPWTADLDCAQCHASNAAPTGTDDALRPDGRRVHPASMIATMVWGHQQSRPDRPQWPCLA
jgi:hypothetical protein